MRVCRIVCDSLYSPLARRWRRPNRLTKGVLLGADASDLSHTASGGGVRCITRVRRTPARPPLSCAGVYLPALRRGARENIPRPQPFLYTFFLASPHRRASRSPSRLDFLRRAGTDVRAMPRVCDPPRLLGSLPVAVVASLCSTCAARRRPSSSALR